jgi:hypothetical protein
MMVKRPLLLHNYFESGIKRGFGQNKNKKA